ncbi:hypothetical protein PR048_000906 [Dryococelus australis]|uniref:Secreted protein n=1 Tax=Dryococelus australis TaxID=614101 RepID=A0ABQ9IHC6_9NEOP|nr:hypothetical protein PR048_000906 [Dryococelus australis]
MLHILHLLALTGFFCRHCILNWDFSKTLLRLWIRMAEVTQKSRKEFLGVNKLELCSEMVISRICSVQFKKSAWRALKGFSRHFLGNHKSPTFVIL